MTKELITRAKRVKIFIMDVDGVMTDGRIILNSRGEELKFFDVRDGYGIILLHRYGIKTALISGGESKITALRAENLGIEIVYQGIMDKLPVYKNILQRGGYQEQEVAYIGDDLIDYEIMQRVGLSIAVGDALPLIKKKADLVTQNNGGRGAIREAIDFILKAKALLPYA